MDKTTDKSQLVIVDSNIIQYAAQQKSSQAFKAYTDDLANRGFDFTISEISIFELLKGANKRNEVKMTALLDEFSKTQLSGEILQYAAKLESAYKLENIQPQEVEDGDKLIAATAILYSGIILTANAMDFPAPFFREVERQFITFEYKRKRTRTIVVYLLQPQLEITEKRIAEIPQ